MSTDQDVQPREGPLSRQAQSGPDHMPLALGLDPPERFHESAAREAKGQEGLGLFGREMRRLRRWKVSGNLKGSEMRGRTEPQGHRRPQQK